MLQRRHVLGAGAGLMLAAPALGQNSRASTLRFVPQANLSVLDPIVTTATVTGNHGFYVFDTLYGVNAELKPQPQMVEGHPVEAMASCGASACAKGALHDGALCAAATAPPRWRAGARGSRSASFSRGRWRTGSAAKAATSRSA